MDYKNLILTLYKVTESDSKIVEFCKNNELFAVTMGSNKGLTNLPKKLLKTGTISYVHTINDFRMYEKLRKTGFMEFIQITFNQIIGLKIDLNQS